MAALLLSPRSTSASLLPRAPPFTPCRRCIHKLHATRSFSSASLGSNGYGGPLVASNPGAQRKPYLRQHSCLVFPPPRGHRPLAVVKFLGGAFIGAVPEVTYSYLIELLAQEGFLVVSVPYNVTFDHEMAAREVFERFHACYDALITSGVPAAGLSPLDVARLPVYCVGHSNGALLQLLVGSYFSEKIPKANAIVSFNNRSASEAVPYFEQIGPFFSQVMPIMEASPVYSMATNASATRDFPGGAWKAVFDTAETLIREYDQEAMVSLSKFVDQLPSVMDQVRQGISEFKPTPPENREFFKNSYNIPNTLLVKFSTDAIDDTDIVEDILRSRVESIGGQMKKVTLPGTHLTPCVQDVKWQAGYQYTPADALAQGLKSLALNETRVLSRTVADWFRSLDFQ